MTTERDRKLKRALTRKDHLVQHPDAMLALVELSQRDKELLRMHADELAAATDDELWGWRWP